MNCHSRRGGGGGGHMGIRQSMYLQEFVDEASTLGAGAQEEDEVGVAQLGQALGLPLKM